MPASPFPEIPLDFSTNPHEDVYKRQVLITERIIKIHTSAMDKDGNKELEAGKDVTIIDTVTLEGLEVGTQYKLVGWQMLKEENAELLITGKRVESDYTFTEMCIRDRLPTRSFLPVSALYMVVLPLLGFPANAILIFLFLL